MDSGIELVNGLGCIGTLRLVSPLPIFPRTLPLTPRRKGGGEPASKGGKTRGGEPASKGEPRRRRAGEQGRAKAAARSLSLQFFYPKAPHRRRSGLLTSGVRPVSRVKILKRTDGQRPQASGQLRPPDAPVHPDGCPEVSILRRHDSGAASPQENPTRRLEYQRSPHRAAMQPRRLRAPGLMSGKVKGGAPDSAGSALFSGEAPSSCPDELDQAMAAFWGDLPEGVDAAFWGDLLEDVDPYGGDSLPEDKAGGSDQLLALPDLTSAGGVSCLSSRGWWNSRRRAATQRRVVGGDPAPFSLHSNKYGVWDAAKELAGVELSAVETSQASLPDTVNLESSGYEALTVESFEEPGELDLKDAYFKYLVDRFVAAAYPAGMIETVATEPRPQEAPTTPGASARSMEAWAARQVTEKEAGASSRSMEARDARQVTEKEGAGAVPKRVIISMVPCERWTWKHQTTVDGPNGLTVLSPTVKQLAQNTCMAAATEAVMESNLRVQHMEYAILSLHHLVQLLNDSRTKFPNVKIPMERLFLIVQTEGVLSVADYRNRHRQNSGDALRYYITRYRHYKVDNPQHMKHALYAMRERGPLMGVIKISKNYDECAKSGEIYKYDPNQVDKDDDGKPKSTTHAVCIISFAIEKLPYLECQNSHGEEFSDYLKIDVTSLCQLWSIEVKSKAGAVQG